MPSVRTPVLLAAVLALGAPIALASAQVSAQPATGLAQLRQIFAEGRALEDKGHWAEALEKFKQVAAGKMTPQVRFHIALCEENVGKLVSAMKGFDLAAEEGTAAGSSAVEVPPAAKQHADALRGRIAKVHVDVTGKIASSKILLDDTPLDEKELGVDVDVDPGHHVVEVRDGSGKSTFRKELTLAEKGAETVEVTVADEEEPKPPPTPPPPPAPSRVPAYVAGGVGLAALATSGVFFALRSSNIAAVASHCADMVNYTGCSPLDQDLANQGKVYNNVADAMLGVGLAGVATGAVLFFVLSPKKAPASAPAKTASRWGTPRGSPKPPLARGGGANPWETANLWVVPAGPGLRVGGAF